LLAAEGRAEPFVAGTGPVTWGTLGDGLGAERQAAISAATEAMSPVRNQRWRGTVGGGESGFIAMVFGGA